MRSVVVVLTALVALAAPVAVAQTSSDVLVIEDLALPQSHRYEIYNPTSGAYSPIDVRAVPSYVQKKTRVFDRTAGVWVVDASGNLDRRYVADARPSTASARSGEWQRIHGKIENIQGSTLRFRTDDDRLLTVDTSRVESGVRSGLAQGESVTVVAYEWTGPTTVRARYVQQDSSDPAHGGQLAPSASPR